ncbi:MAG TPA: hypothetical protein VNZ52_16590 [Candidatus Thermoplasmatota archaeon]|nr:hypothetical protein [Candidatus Thermoplasmatota archaeon]
MVNEPRKPDLKDPDFPELRARVKFDFEQHVRKAMENGMSREEAEKHALEDMKGEDEALVNPDSNLVGENSSQ